MSNDKTYLATLTTSGSSILENNYSPAQTYSSPEVRKGDTSAQSPVNRFVSAQIDVVVSTQTSRRRDEVARINEFLQKIMT